MSCVQYILYNVICFQKYNEGSIGWSKYTLKVVKEFHYLYKKSVSNKLYSHVSNCMVSNFA